MNSTDGHGWSAIHEALEEHGDAFDTPAVVVVEDVMRRNIRNMQAFAEANSVALRPHVKTHKSTEIAALQMEAGAIGITVSNLAQAEVFASAGITEILLAFPLWPSEPKVRRLRDLAESSHVTVGLESAAAAQAFARAGFNRMPPESARGVRFIIEIDCGGGRSGVAAEESGHLARYATDLGLDVVGVFTYPGHGWARGAAQGAAEDQAGALAQAATSLREQGVEPHVVSAGSTPTAKFSPSPGITEIRPGEYVFYSMDHYHHGICEADEIALFVATTVVSEGAGEPQIVDVGTMSLGREVDGQGRYSWIADDGGVLTRVNEYHGFLDPGGVGPYPVGTILPLIPNHSCTAVQNVNRLTLVTTDGALRTLDVQQFDPC